MKNLFSLFILLIFSINLYAEKITIWGPKATPTVVLLVAKEIGATNKVYPFDIKIWRSVDELRAGLLNKNILMSIVPSYVAANFYNKGMPFKLDNIMTKGILYLISKDASIKKIADLKGKKILVPFKNDLPDFILRLLILHDNLNNIDINYVSNAIEGVNLFLTKNYDAILLPEPVASIIELKAQEQKINLFRSLNIQAIWNEYFQNSFIPQAGLMINSDFSKKNEKFLQMLRKDLRDAVTWIEKNPNEAAKIGEKYLNYPESVITKSLLYSNLVVLDSKEVKMELVDFFDKLLKINPKIVGGKIPDDNFFNK